MDWHKERVCKLQTDFRFHFSTINSSSCSYEKHFLTFSRARLFDLTCLEKVKHWKVERLKRIYKLILPFSVVKFQITSRVKNTHFSFIRYFFLLFGWLFNFSIYFSANAYLIRMVFMIILKLSNRCWLACCLL